MFVVFTCIGVA